SKCAARSSARTTRRLCKRSTIAIRRSTRFMGAKIAQVSRSSEDFFFLQNAGPLTNGPVANTASPESATPWRALGRFGAARRGLRSMWQKGAGKDALNPAPYAYSPCARTRKNPAGSKGGTIALDWELVSNGCQSGGLNAAVRSITNGANPPDQSNCTSGP